MKNIAFVVAHPDDLAHSMGGTALLLKDDYRLHVFCLTKGERGIKGKSLAEAAAIREKEEQAAADLLGAELSFLGQIDGEVFADRAACEDLAVRLKALEPAGLFTLWPINVADHIAAYTIATKALHLAGRFHETEIYMSESGPGGQTNMYEPDLYVDITPVVDAKRELIRCHRSQNATEANVEKVLDRNRFRGLLARCEFAEPFKLVNPPVNQRWGKPWSSLLLNIAANG